ncbi:hypothetical protein ACFVH4_15710 [Nocardia ignorata]|uniref:hypothetical protein n=2 Tax=Actinomycetes TaxID=1760 RepID=UPI00362F9A61
MTEPTRAQARVLEALQNRSVAVVGLLTQAQTFDGLAPQEWLVTYHHQAVACADLAAAARAGGVPRVWIEQVQARGENGVPWDPKAALIHPGPTDWDRILTDLTTDVARIQEWEALDAAYHQLEHPTGETASAGLRTKIDAVRMRTAGVTNILGLTSELSVELWGDVSDWAHYAAATLDDVPGEQIVHRWHAATETDTRAYAGQATALATDAAIPVDTAAALPTTADLRAAINTELGSVQAQFVSAGTTIGSAVEAAISPPADVPTEVMFSAPSEPDRPWTGTVEHAEAAPVFSNVDGAGW